ncbi:MAG: glycosyl transferase [Nitrospirales bacterium]|nr:MAG: glycosyl transferase [Nitrospirales bacterium]
MHDNSIRSLMRILHIVSTLSPASGGPTQVLKGLAKAQSVVGHEVTVCTTNRDNPVQQKLPDSYFQMFYSGQVTLKVFPVNFTPLLFSPGLAHWLRKSIQSFDIVHVHGLYRFPPTFAAAQARKQNVPYIIRPHGSIDPYLYDKSSRNVRLKRLYERWFDIPNLHGADAIHYTAAEERDRVGFLNLRAPSFVVPNGLDWTPYESLPSRGALRTRYNLGESPVVLFLGRLHFKKGLDLLIPAFDKVRQTITDAKLVIVGPENDSYGEKVRSWVRDRGLDESVHFIGSLHGEDVVQAYVDADVFALPSYTENFGMTVAEAMACKLPVVISDQVNIHAEVSQAGSGLVTACDADEIAAALEVLLRAPERRTAMGTAGRRLVQDRYTWPRIVDSLTKEYETIIERHRAGLDVNDRVVPISVDRP